MTAGDTPEKLGMAGDEIAPSRYRRLPVELEAIRWSGSNLRAVIAFTGRHVSSEAWEWEYFERVVRESGLKIFTLEGPKMATVGDYIIKGVKGECYPCKPDIFWKIYERAAQQPVAPVALPEPAGWRREWDGDVSDAGMWVEAWTRDELDERGPWESLYTESQVRSLLESLSSQAEQLRRERDAEHGKLGMSIIATPMERERAEAAEAEFLGDVFGVRIIERPECPNDLVQIMVEDDGNWFPKGQPFDAAWIDDLVKHLLLAKCACKITFEPPRSR